MPGLDRLILSTFQVMCLGATIVEQDPYLTYLDDPWTPTADGRNIRWHNKKGQTFFMLSNA